MTRSRSLRGPLKNRALSICLATVAKREPHRTDATDHLESGDQPIEAHEALAERVRRYAERRYSGSVQSEFNTMKCIDLDHSGELGELVEKWVRVAP
jgi:hypothetical protein